MYVFCMKHDGKKRSDLTTGIILSNCWKRRASGRLRPLVPLHLSGPQTPRRSSLIAHSFTSSYAPDSPLYTYFTQRFEFFYLLLASFIYIVHISRGRGLNSFIYYQPPLYTQFTYVEVEVGILLFIIKHFIYIVHIRGGRGGNSFIYY